jgi:MoaA/NifB/PqqE/SkfB family radical SAM enzyme
LVAAWIERLLGRARRRPIDGLQVEITTHCQLHCSFCPHEALRSSWNAQHMPMELFERLVPSLRQARFVHLQGWGEPLLHPDLFRMVQLAKAAGCEVGLTTNGVLLSREVSREMVRLGVDLVAVSIAGANSSTHATLRKGSDLQQIAANVAGLAEEKRRSGSERPKIVLMYVMLRSNLPELPQTVELAGEIGAQELAATNMDYVVNEEQDAERAFALGNAEPASQGIIDDATKRASSLGVLFRPYPLAAQEHVAACEAMAAPTTVVAADGGVFPCVYLSVPVDPIPRLFRGDHYEVPRLPFGQIAGADLSALWVGAEYRAFRRIFHLRRGLASNLAIQQVLGQEFSWDPAGRTRKGESILDQVEKGAPLPEVCRSCYKALGV